MAFADALLLELAYQRAGTPYDFSSTLVAIDASNGYKFSNDGRTLLLVSNDGSGSVVVTVYTPGTVEGLAIANRTYTITQKTAAGPHYVLLGPFSSIHNQPGTQEVYVTFDTDDDISVCPIRLA